MPETRALTVGQCFACLVKTVNVCPNRCLVISSFQLTGFSFNNWPGKLEHQIPRWHAQLRKGSQQWQNSPLWEAQANHISMFELTRYFFLKKWIFFLFEWKRFCLTFLRFSNFSPYSAVYFISEMWPKHVSKTILLNNTAFSRWWINETILSYITCRMSSWILSIGSKVQAKEYHIIMFMSVMLKSWKVLFGSLTDQVSRTRYPGIGRRKKRVTKITPLICHLAMKLQLSKVTHQSAQHQSELQCQGHFRGALWWVRWEANIKKIKLWLISEAVKCHMSVLTSPCLTHNGEVMILYVLTSEMLRSKSKSQLKDGLSLVWIGK